MTNKAKIEKAIEVLVVLALPVALVVGCAGSGNVQPELTALEDISSIEQSYSMDELYPLFENEVNNLQANKTDIMKVEAKDLVTKSGDIVVANTNTDALVEGANSSLAVIEIIEMQPDYLVFNFDSDSDKVHGYDHYFLKQHAGYLNSNANLILKIRGHTDSRGSRTYNEKLSKRRAEMIKTLLISFDAPESQIQIIGLGEIEPVGSESKMQENRRVELNYIDSTMVSAR